MSKLNFTTREALKRADPDRFRAALMAESSIRDDLLTLYAFHHELAKVPDVTSEPMLGQIRYEWWREAIDEIYLNRPVRRHEITTPLAELLLRREIPRFWVDQLIDARAKDLDPQPFEDMAAARAYCQETSGGLMRIAAKIAGGGSFPEAGEAWGLTGLARSYRFYHDRILQNVSFEELTTAATDTYQTAKAASKDVLEQAFPAIAYVALVPGFLKRMSRPGFDPKADSVDYSPLAKQFHLMRVAIKGKI